MYYLVLIIVRNLGNYSNRPMKTDIDGKLSFVVEALSEPASLAIIKA